MKERVGNAHGDQGVKALRSENADRFDFRSGRDH